MVDGAWIAAAGAALMLGLTVLLGIEARQLALRRTPITDWTRYAMRRWPGWSLIIVGCFLVFVGAVLAHLLGWANTCI